MPIGMTSPRKRSLLLSAAAVLFGACGVVLSWPLVDGEGIRSSDSSQYERIAFNMVRHGEFHDSRRPPQERDVLRPYTRRTPGYPAYLAAVFATFPEIGGIGHACISDPECAAAVPVRRRVQQVTAVLAGLTVAATFLAAWVLTGSRAASAAAGLLCLLLLPRDIPSLLSGFLLLGHAVLAAETWRRPRLVTGVASGIALGLLVLTRAIFQYWLAGVVIVWLAAAWRDAGRGRASAPAFAALLVAAWSLTLPWMVRNAVQAGEFGISGRDGEVLAIRAEYGRMTWAELRGAFAYFLPVPSGADGLRRTAMCRLEPEVFGYARFDRGNPEGFYRRAKNMAGDVAARANEIDPEWRADRVARDAALTRASLELMREDWLKHAALTLVFAERGSGFSDRTICRRAADFLGVQWGWRYGRWLALRVCYVAGWFSYLFLPALGWLLVLAWKRRDAATAFLLLPAACSFGFHALATHFVPRYSFALIPVLALAFTLAAREVCRPSTAGGRRSRTDGATGPRP